jgi:hypothetical protein
MSGFKFCNFHDIYFSTLYNNCLNNLVQQNSATSKHHLKEFITDTELWTTVHWHMFF